MKKHKYFVLLALVMTPIAYATDSVSIYQIAITGMSVPGTGGTFTSFSAPTTDRNLDFDTGQNPFWFIATSSNGNSGVFVYDAYYQEFFDLVDTTMAALTGGKFETFSNLSSGQGAIGFVATDTNGVQGVYGIGDIPLTLIATSNTSPASGVTFGDIQHISISGSPYGFPSGDIQSAAGDYLAIVNSGTYSFYALASGTSNGTFSSVGPVSSKQSLGNSNLPGISESAAAFAANIGSVRSVFYGGPGSGTGILALASVGGSTPNSSGTFTSFGNPVVTANEVSFTAHYSNASGDQQGIFVFGGYLGPIENPGGNPTLWQVVATGQLAPNSGGATFSGFSDLSDSSFDQTFIASLSNGGEGLYMEVGEGTQASPGPQLLKVVATGDVLNGKTISGIELAPDASNLYEIATAPYGSPNEGTGFEVNFTDGSEGLYYFDINLPEPASLALMGLPMLFMLRRR